MIGVTPGGAAQNAGLRKGDHLLAVEGQSIEVGAKALKDFSGKVAEAKKSNPSRLNLTVGSPEGRREMAVTMDQVCHYDNIVMQGDEAQRVLRRREYRDDVDDDALRQRPGAAGRLCP